MASQPLKEHIKQHCLSVINEKIAGLQSAITSVNESANNETKSSAGDKHETAKAMMQLEQEKLSKQLSDLQNQYNDLDKIDCSTSSAIIRKGSLIETDKGWFFISVGLGKLQFDNKVVFAVSEQSPIGKFLLEKNFGATFEFNGISYSVKSVH